MEFEIDELAYEDRIIVDCEVLRPNHAPGWCQDAAGGEHSGVWDAEVGRNRLELT